MENNAFQGLKIHYLFSYHNQSDCIGNLPTHIASSLKKINLKSVVLDFHAPCSTPAYPCLCEWLCNLIVRTVIHPSSASVAVMMSFLLYPAIYFVGCTHIETLIVSPLALQKVINPILSVQCLKPVISIT